MTADEGAPQRARVLLIEDHPLIRDGVADLLDGQPDLELCGTANDAAAGLRAVAEQRPDLVIVDLTLPGGSGLELIKRIRAAHGEVRVLVFSMHDEKLFAERAIAAGAMGYVNKQQAPGELLAAMRHVMKGQVTLSPEMTDRLLHGIARAPAGEQTAQPLPERLTDRELEVFELLGRGRTTREVAEGLELSIKTVQTHFENIKKKLGLSSINELIVRAAQWVAREL